MFDSSRVHQEDSDNLSLRMDSNILQGHGLHMTGEIIDRIFVGGKLVEERVGHNLVVDSFVKLIMSLLKNQTGYSGVKYWAVGSGADIWDSDMPNPEGSATRLTSEIGRVAISPEEISFLDSDLNETDIPTNILQIKHTFGANDCNGTWREFGIFGGNATTTANSGLLINKRHHAVITKTDEMTIERTMRFTLSLV